MSTYRQEERNLSPAYDHRRLILVLFAVHDRNCSGPDVQSRLALGAGAVTLVFKGADETGSDSTIRGPDDVSRDETGT
jgi:hypothetical protein